MTYDLTNRRFGNLIALRDIGTRRSFRLWECQCDCGKLTQVVTSKLLRGDTKSCGCIQGHRRRLPEGISSARGIYRVYKKRAEKRYGSFELTFDDFYRLTKLPCYYCDAPPHNNSHLARQQQYYGVHIFNGLDRLDNHRGYALDNIVPCCKECNKAKLTMSAEAYITLCKAVAHKFS